MGPWNGFAASSRLILRWSGLCGASMFALSPENTLRNSRYSIGITLRGSSGGSVAMALASSQCGVGRRVSIGDSRNIALPVSWLSFLMVLSFIRQLYISYVVMIVGFSGSRPVLG